MGYIEIYCPTCNTVRFRSTRSFAQGDTPSPSDFIALAGDPVPEGNSPPICGSCHAICKARLVPDEDAEERPAPVERRKVSEAPSVHTLFSVDGDEMIHTVKDGPGYVTIITTKRVVRIKV